MIVHIMKRTVIVYVGLLEMVWPDKFMLAMRDICLFQSLLVMLVSEPVSSGSKPKQFLKSSVLRMNDLPRTKEVYLAIGWWKYTDHSAGAPIDKPLLSLANDIV
jgi:hypothetical protein